MIDYLVEFIGTFVFLSVIIVTGNPIAIAMALATMIYFGGKVSGGHFNPAVNVMMYLNKKMSTTKLIGQTVAQLLGAVAAFMYFKTIHDKK
jgi:aquaporin Z